MTETQERVKFLQACTHCGIVEEWEKDAEELDKYHCMGGKLCKRCWAKWQDGTHPDRQAFEQRGRDWRNKKNRQLRRARTRYAIAGLCIIASATAPFISLAAHALIYPLLIVITYDMGISAARYAYKASKRGKHDKPTFTRTYRNLLFGRAESAVAKP